MRVLCLTPELPYAPGGTGGSTRQFHLLKGLVALGHEVHVVAPVHADQREGAQLLQAAGLALHAADRPPSRVAETARAVARRPGLLAAALREPLLAWQVDVFWSALRPIARAVAAQHPPDVVLVEHDWAAAWAGDLGLDVPSALTPHNLSWEYYDARARAAGGVRARALRAEAARFRRHDARHLPGYDLLIAMSEDDRAAVRRLIPSARVETVPNGVDLVDSDPPPTPGDGLLLFTGTLSYPPNAEGLLWLLREIWPRIRALAPQARLRVVGRGAPAEAQALAGDGVELTGWVESMEPHFAAADVVLVPILSGGGTRLKVLDAMAARRPIVSTPQGWAGVDVEPGVHLLSESDPDGFARAVAGLLGDPARREALGAAARARAEESYDWRALGDRLEALLTSLTAR